MLLLGRIALVALVIGTTAAVLGSGRLTPGLILSSVAVWGFVPLLQAVTGLMLLWPHASGAALSAYFGAHRPWSLWLIGFALVMLVVPAAGELLWSVAATSVVPAAVTWRQLHRIRQRVSGDGARAAWRRVALHQAVTVAFISTYIAWAIGGWWRLLGGLRW